MGTVVGRKGTHNLGATTEDHIVEHAFGPNRLFTFLFLAPLSVPERGGGVRLIFFS